MRLGIHLTLKTIAAAPFCVEFNVAYTSIRMLTPAVTDETRFQYHASDQCTC